MAQGTETLAVVIILAAAAYVLYRWNVRRDQIHCPNCGNRIDLYADECPHCGYQKGEALKERLEREVMEAEESESEEEEDEGGADGGGEGNVCEDCGREFDTEQGLKIHRGMAH